MGMTIAFELFKLAVVGLIAGLFSSTLANRDHRGRKWWEMRVAAYQGAIEALSDLVYYYDKRYASEANYRELSSETEEKLKLLFQKSFPKIRRLTDTGAFLFSDQAQAALKDFVNQDESDFYLEMLENYRAKAKACLEKLVNYSKEDLSLTSKWQRDLKAWWNS